MTSKRPLPYRYLSSGGLMEPKLKERQRIALRLFLVTFLSIFGVELGIMGLLPPLPQMQRSLLDSGVLALIMLPLLYMAMIRPLLDLIDRQKELEAVIRVSEERFRNLAAAAYDAIVMMDAEGRIIFWNKGAERIFGHAANEIVGKPLHEILCNSEDRALFEKAFLYFKVTGSGPIVGKTRELMAIHKNGSHIPIELSLSAQKVKGQWHSIGVVREIGERKRAEEELRLSAKAQRTLSENLAKAQEIAHMGNWVWDMKENSATCSDELYRILGLSPQSLQINYKTFLNYVHPQDQTQFLEAVQEAIQSKKRISLELRILRADGGETKAQLQAEALVNEGVDGIRIFGILQDITERKRLEEEAAAFRTEKERLDTLRTISTTYAHHIGNAITPLKGFAELLLLKTDPSDPRYSYAKSILEGSIQAEEIVDKLKETVDFEKMKFGGIEILDIKEG